MGLPNMVLALRGLGVSIGAERSQTLAGAALASVGRVQSAHPLALCFVNPPRPPAAKQLETQRQVPRQKEWDS